MRHWNYRVVKQVSPSGASVFGIHDVYYNKKGLICSVSQQPSTVQVDALDGLPAELDRMKRALNSPPLNYDELPQGDDGPDDDEDEEDDG